MIEHLRPGASAANARVALFDFDGTISVIRSGWMEIMIPMMVEILMDLKTGEREEDLRAIVEEFVGRLTGKQTMYQMIALAEEKPSALLCFERDPAHCHRTPLRETVIPDWEAVDLYC